MEFCARTFNADGVVAEKDPDLVTLPGSYDLIWCGSLFTHLPERECLGLLGLFERHLEPGGVLIFTTHGRTIYELLDAGRLNFAIQASGRRELCRGYEKDGFGFEPYTHSRDGGYGITVTSMPWVQRALERGAGLELVAHNEAEWDGRQDAVVCRAARKPVRRKGSPRRSGAR